MAVRRPPEALAEALADEDVEARGDMLFDDGCALMRRSAVHIERRCRSTSGAPGTHRCRVSALLPDPGEPDVAVATAIHGFPVKTAHREAAETGALRTRPLADEQLVSAIRPVAADQKSSA